MILLFRIQKAAHPIDGLGDVFLAVGVRQSNIAFAKNTEIRSANSGDSSLFEEGACKPTGFPNTTPEKGADGSRTANAPKYIGSGTADSLGANASDVQDTLANGFTT